MFVTFSWQNQWLSGLKYCSTAARIWLGLFPPQDKPIRCRFWFNVTVDDGGIGREQDGGTRVYKKPFLVVMVVEVVTVLRKGGRGSGDGGCGTGPDVGKELAKKKGSFAVDFGQIFREVVEENIFFI